MRRARSNQSNGSWWVAFIALFSGIGGGVVFPILPMLGMQLGLSAAMVGLILAANRITRIFFNPLTGSLVDRFGVRWPVATGLFLETIAVLSFSAALRSQSPAVWFVGGRIVWGVGSSLIMIGALAAVMMIGSESNRGRLISRVRISMTLGIPAGMLLGGVVSDLVSPNAAFLTTSAITFVTGLVAVFALPSSAVLVVAGEWSSARSIWSQLLRHPVLQVIWCSNSLVFFALGGVLLSTLVVLVDVRGVHIANFGSQGTAGLLMALLMIFRAVAALGAGRLADRQTSRRPQLLVPGALGCAFGFAVLALAQQAWDMALGLILVGLGSGALTVTLLALLSEAVTPQTQGRAMGIYQVYGDIGGSVGPIVGLQLGAFTGYGPIYIGVSCAMVLAIVPLHYLYRRSQIRL